MSQQRSIETINARKTPLQSVTVFTDRAEIIRKISVFLKSGINEIRVENVAGSVESNSIRVDGVGDAVIHGVKYESKPVNFDEIDLPKVKQLRSQLKEVEAEAQKERDLQSIYNARVEALNNAVKTIGQSSTKGDSSNIVNFNDGSEVSIDNFFDYHERRSLELKAKLRVVDERIRTLDLEIQRLNDELNQYRWNLDSKNIISIEIENHGADTQAELDITYQVYGAHWSPSYDIRVKSENDRHEMNITYFGSIQQQTGEDWTDVDLHLSTAQPGLGGDLPKLGTTVVQFKPKPPPPPPQLYQNYSSRGGQYNEMACDLQEVRLERCAPKMAHMAASATENTLATTFTIPNKKTIPSDTAEHKITITVATIPAYLNYHCVPKKDSNVFLMATVINDTDYPILAGPASVYVNNSMSAMINLRATSAGEKLECPLGVDKTVKVIYKPTHKFQTKVGLINKNSSSGNEQRIVVKNTKRSEAILITLHEPIPKSADEKIKVTLTSPDISKNASKDTEVIDNRTFNLPSVGAELDDLNNLLWTDSVEPGSEKTFIVKWSVDFPPNEILEYGEQRQQE